MKQPSKAQVSLAADLVGFDAEPLSPIQSQSDTQESALTVSPEGTAYMFRALLSIYPKYKH
jgi:hypothetical protein